MELVVLSTATRYARCRTADPQGEIVVLRSNDVWKLVPGEIATVLVSSRFKHLGESYVAGTITRVRLHFAAMGLAKLRVSAPALSGIRSGDELDGPPGPARYLEQDVRAPDLLGPLRSPDEVEEGIARAHQLLERDERGLDAHAFLGRVALEKLDPERARRHFEVGVSLGLHALGGPAWMERRNGEELPWDAAGNAAFLRCLHGRALCQWRHGHLDEAAVDLQRLLRLDPEDPLEVYFDLEDVRAGRAWNELVHVQRAA
jgi:hypothetical protein